jgi:guanylate kinase
MKNLIVISSPSGGGKSTLTKHLMSLYPELEFSVSATTRPIREGEENGKDYFFLTPDEFEAKIKSNEFAEWEEFFGNKYGTLKSEIEKAVSQDKRIIFDVDVKGAMSLKKAFPEESLLIFIAPPNKEALRERLQLRSTESDEDIEKRVERSEMEMSFAVNFDHVVINDDLQEAKEEIGLIAKNYFK